VTKGGYIYLLGGENGFVCEPLPFCTPPYFNDVWRTRDGVTWELVTPAAGWSPRPGHACVVAAFHIVCFGGFGLLQNPVDMWASFDGARWVRLPTPPWNATSPDQIKYDFAALSAAEGIPGVPTAIYTFGGIGRPSTSRIPPTTGASTTTSGDTDSSVREASRKFRPPFSGRVTAASRLFPTLSLTVGGITREIIEGAEVLQDLAR